MSGRSSRTIYVGNLPGDIRLREVEDLFYKVCFLMKLSYISENNCVISFILMFEYTVTHEKKTSRSSKMGIRNVDFLVSAVPNQLIYGN